MKKVIRSRESFLIAWMFKQSRRISPSSIAKEASGERKERMRLCPISNRSLHLSRFTPCSILCLCCLRRYHPLNSFSLNCVPYSITCLSSYLSHPHTVCFFPLLYFLLQTSFPRLFGLKLFYLFPFHLPHHLLNQSSYLFSFLSPGLHLLRLYPSTSNLAVGALLALTNFRLITVITSINERGLSS